MSRTFLTPMIVILCTQTTVACTPSELAGDDEWCESVSVAQGSAVGDLAVVALTSVDADADSGAPRTIERPRGTAAGGAIVQLASEYGVCDHVQAPCVLIAIASARVELQLPEGVGTFSLAELGGTVCGYADGDDWTCASLRGSLDISKRTGQGIDGTLEATLRVEDADRDPQATMSARGSVELRYRRWVERTCEPKTGAGCDMGPWPGPMD